MVELEDGVGRWGRRFSSSTLAAALTGELSRENLMRIPDLRREVEVWNQERRKRIRSIGVN